MYTQRHDHNPRAGADQNQDREQRAPERRHDTEDAAEDEEPSLEDRRRYEFSESIVKAETGPTVDLEQSFLEKAKAHLDIIEREYNRMFALRVDIDNLLKGFKQRLRVSKTAQLSVCFKNLRDLVGKYETLELSQEEQLHIVIGEEACEDAKEAVAKFNTMLERCSEYPEKQREAEATIQQKIVALEKDRVQTQATVDAQQRAKTQLMKIHQWGEEIQSLVKVTKSSAKYLLSRNVTGLQTTIRED